MSLQSHNKINPNFSMSSMTDIVFLLLIFFMLTSTLVTTNASNSVYPSNFTIGTRVLGGSIDKYLEQGAPDTFTWGNNKALRLQVGEKVGNTVYGIDFNSSSCSFTNRIKPMRVFGEEYNWRMTQNPTALSSVLTYTTT